MRIRVRFGSNSEIYRVLRVPCDENEKIKDVIVRAIETYKKCQGKEHLDVEVKYLKNKQGETIIVDNSKIKNVCDYIEELTAIIEESDNYPHLQNYDDY